MKKTLFDTPIKVWYRSHPKIQKVLWPIIDVRFSYRKIILPQTLDSLIDSGANLSILHSVVAEVLGFDLNRLGSPKKGGLSVSGNYESWALPNPIELNIYGHTFQKEFTVINNPNLIWPCILGEDSIFEFARLDFQKFKGYFEVRFRTDIN